jgi:lipopolysaccharide/colanic/teichoic acid biosynthesis glycosyltransferase
MKYETWIDCAALHTPWGRACLQLRAEYGRLLWWWNQTGHELAKRGMDVLLSAVALLLLSPLFAFIAFCIKCEDRGPIFFIQTRVGKYGRHFKMFKFRSMCLNAEEKLRDLLARNQHGDGVTFKIKADPRITRVGRILRKFSLDELPQFYNVFRGDMTLVGPRPPVPREVALYKLPDHRRLAAHPGITCIWQVSGRSEIDFCDQVKLDVDYIEKQNLWLDMQILAKTIPAVLWGKGAC